jgi:DNA-binding beta-propeller fold protein YncE
VALAFALPAAAVAAPIPLAQYGAAGAGAGELDNPKSVAIAGDGDLYVVEQGGQRISVFSPAGAFIHAFGWGVDTGAAAFEVCTTASGCQAGSVGGGAGQLNFPRAADIDAAGNLYVVDNNQRISVFNTADPSFVRGFGWGADTGAAAFEVCTTASGCQTGSFGGGAGELSFAVGLALDGAGGLYVADSDNHRISVFDTATPSFTRAFGWGVDTGAAAFEVCTTATGCQAAGFGSGAGQMQNPAGVVLDGPGTLYVTDTANHRISVFDTAGPIFARSFGWGVDTGGAALETCTTISGCQAGSNGGGAGQLSSPAGPALDAAGRLYVGEIGDNHRVSVFDAATSAFVHAFGRGVDTGATAFEVCTTASGCQSATAGTGPGELEDPQGVRIDCRGAAWVADSDNNRLQRIGEPGTQSPPCSAPVDPATPDPTPPGGDPIPPAGLPPSNAFTIDRLRGRVLTLNLASPGTVVVADAAAAPRSARAGGRRKLLKTTSADGGPGALDVRLKLTKAGKSKLRRNRKVKVNARITFTPSGGAAGSQTAKLKIRKR